MQSESMGVEEANRTKTYYFLQQSPMPQWNALCVKIDWRHPPHVTSVCAIGKGYLRWLKDMLQLCNPPQPLQAAERHQCCLGGRNRCPMWRIWPSLVGHTGIQPLLLWWPEPLLLVVRMVGCRCSWGWGQHAQQQQRNGVPLLWRRKTVNT